MQDFDQNNKNDFVIEKIKERPVNKKKLIKRTITTASLAVMFGLIACFTFLVLEPVISDWLYPQEEPQAVIFPEEQEEMEPEEMLSDNLEATPEPTVTPMPAFPIDSESEQVQEILDSFTLDIDNYVQMYNALGDYVKELNKYLVTVTATESSTDWLANVTEKQTQTTGVVIGNNGRELMILTNYNVLKNAESLEVTFSDNFIVDAQLKQRHSGTDIAILSVNLNVIGDKIKDIHIASFGSSSMQSLLCTPVIALGSPLGESGSVGYGMITSESGQITMVDGNYKLLVTDIYGSQNASGFLFNLKGQIIGMITNKKTTSDMRNVVTAYGISDLKKLITNLSKGSYIAYIGIIGKDVSTQANADAQVPMGMYVQDVAMDSPAMQAGIQPGDIVVGIGNKIISRANDYFSAITDLESGTTVKLKIMRQFQDEYKEMEFDILLGTAE